MEDNKAVAATNKEKRKSIRGSIRRSQASIREKRQQIRRLQYEINLSKIYIDKLRRQIKELA